VVGIVLLAILGYALYSSRKSSDLSSEDDDEFASRTDIVAEIAVLDEEYEANNIDEDDYNDQRNELKRLALEFDDNSSTDDDDDDDDSEVDADRSAEFEDDTSEEPGK
jgi:hypothetical protein